LKTKSKYLSSGTLLLIAAIVALQVPEGFSGILLLPLSRFVYYGLTFGSGIPFFVQIIVLSGLFILSSFLLKFSFTGKFSFPGFGNGIIHHQGASGIVYLASQTQSNTTNLKKKPVLTQEPQKKPETEQGILMVSSGSIMFANKAFFKISGYQPLDIFGKDFATFIRPDSLVHYTMLCRIPAADIPNSPGIVLYSGNNKSLVAYSGASIDSQYDPSAINIFYVKQENVQPAHESSLDSMLFESIENVETLHWIWDEKGILYMNNSCRNNLPFSLGLVINKPGLMMKSVLKRDRNAIREAIGEYYKTGKFSQDVCCTSEQGEVAYFRVNISKRAIGNMPLQHHATAYDITGEKLSLLKAEAAALEAETANKNKTAFLANISHEIRSPLNGIIGFSELLADKNLTDAERERYLNIIQNNGNALISLLSDLIDISKLESGNLEICKRRFKPVKLLEDLRHQFESMAGEKADEVNVVFTANTSIKDIEIESDPNRLRQVLVNLITNAKKFTVKGRIEIGADFSGNEMLFWVKDTGIGIPYDKQTAVFERFRQVDSPDTKPVLGFGLGLAISKALVELLGGHLWLESQPETGSLFAFTIKTNNINDTMETNHLKETGSYPYDFKEHTILIAEDIDFSFLYIEAVLRRTGIKILWAQNGKEAIEHVKSNSDIDLVMMDMHMPIMNGYEASEVISGLRPELPIIAQTAFVLPEDVKKCYAAGCTGYLAKPIRKEQLLNTLAEYFDKMESREETMPLYRVNIG
jgi:signal transduction histidine kinase/CheY-like chemotaxis protein